MRILAILALAASSWGATISSTAGGGNWHTNATWSGGVIPNFGDDVILNGSVTCEAGQVCNVGKSLPQTPLWTGSMMSTQTPYRPTVQVTGDGSGCGAATGGSLQAGAYRARFTWVNAKGETGPSAESAQFTVASGNIPCISVGSIPSDVTSWSLYLTAAGGGNWTETLYASGIATAKFAMSAAQSAGAAIPAYGVGGIRMSAGTFTVNGTLNIRGDLTTTSNNRAMTVNGGAVIEFDSSAAVAPSTTRYYWMPTHQYGGNGSLTAVGSAGSRITVRSNASGANFAMIVGYDDRVASVFTPGTVTLGYIDFLRVGGSDTFGFYWQTFAGLTVHHCVFDSTQEFRMAGSIDVTQPQDIHDNTWKNSLPIGTATITSLVLSSGGGGFSPNTLQINTSTSFPVPTSEAGQIVISGVTTLPAVNGTYTTAGEGYTLNSSTQATVRAGFLTPGTYSDAGMTVSGYANNLYIPAANGTITGTRNLSHNVFDRWVVIGARGATVNDNIFMVGGRQSGCCTATFQRNLFRRIDNGSTAVWGDTLDNYILADDNHQGNPHPLYAYDVAAVIRYAYNIFEATADAVIYDAGDISVSTRTTTLYFDHNIVLPMHSRNAASMNCGNATMQGGSWVNGHLYWEHNTCFDNGLNFHEVGTAHVDYVKNSIMWRDTAAASASSCFAQGLLVLDIGCSGGFSSMPIDQILYADYNGKWNAQTTTWTGAAGATYYAHLSYTPGTHDVSGDPQFIDYTRNFGSWAVSLGCSGSTYQDQVACGLTAMSAMNESGWDARYSLPKAMTWIRSGFAPRNAAYANAADDLTAPGAVPFAWQPNPGTMTPIIQ